ncbi:MAG TPA: hypothetical protein VHP58_07115 [Alphaproteobacteria bacterium]|nr:hypothetical protein [Alphaproteobacteria bacterium]
MPVTISPASAPATKLHANACWANMPTLNPAAFREVLGHTIGKVWLDFRTTTPRTDVLLTAWHHGINGWLFSPRTLPALDLPEPIDRNTIVIALESETTNTPTQPVDIFFWRSNVPNLKALTALEHLAHNGTITTYGLSAEAPPALHQWLAMAEDASQAVHGRRKRPGLRALLAPLNVTETAWLHQSTSINHEEPVSPLEFAARLGWGVVATHATSLRRADGLHIPVTNPIAPPPAALQALENAVHAEQALNQALGGWPTTNTPSGGQQLFSLLAHLAAAEAPFASPATGLAWATTLLPDILLTWGQLAARHDKGHPTAPIAPYIEALQRLAFHAQALGQASAAAATQRLFAAAGAPKTADFRGFSLQLATSLPGVAGALVTPQNLPLHLSAMQQADHPDPAPYFPA